VLSGIASSVLAYPTLTRATPKEVDAKLILALDVSSSVSEGRWKIQKQGYAVAFANPEIQKVLLEGPLGVTAVALVQWSEADLQKVVIPWTLINSRETAGVFSTILASMNRTHTGDTGIGAGVRYCTRLMREAPFVANRSIIDVSGDGIENSPYVSVDDSILPIHTARDEAVKQGITINGLVLYGTPDTIRDERLLDYYQANVIGGPRCFALPIENPDQLDVFTKGVEQKLMRELVA
jgi:hypothetical protein